MKNRPRVLILADSTNTMLPQLAEITSNPGLSTYIARNQNDFNRLMQSGHPDICFIPGDVAQYNPEIVPSGIDFPHTTVNLYNVENRILHQAKRYNSNVTGV